MRSSWLAIVAAICACRGTKQPLYPAGSDKDDGHGLLAQASTQFMTDEEAEGALLDSPATDARRGRYGGSAYGGNEYGGSTYAGYVVPQWQVGAPNRVPKYSQVQGLTGAIDGTIALHASSAPSKLAPCNSSVPKVALVYIEKVQSGRPLMNEGRPASVGGTLVKRGCSLAPTIQIVTPLPAALAIHGDAKPATLRINTTIHDLQAAGRVTLPLAAGTTRVDVELPASSSAVAGSGNTGSSAWIVAIDTPYYAITDDRGRFRIDELAAGTYEVTIWQPPANNRGEPITTKRTVKVEARRATRLDLR